MGRYKKEGSRGEVEHREERDGVELDDREEKRTTIRFVVNFSLPR